MSREPGSPLAGASGRRPHDRGSLRRAAATVSATIGAILLGFGVLGAPVVAGAQEPAPGDVVRGAANASADSMSFLIINGGASLGWTFGRSTAAYRDITNTSEGKSIDLGALGALLTQPQCDGQFPPVLDTATLPARTIAESFGTGPQGPFSADVLYPMAAGDTNPQKPLGTQKASTSDTRAESSTTTVNQDFGFFRVEGARSRAWTSFENGVRSAHAEFSAKAIYVLGGIVTFVEPTWSATTTSGRARSEQASFGFKGASVFGNWVSGATLQRDLGIFETLVEGILGPLGVDVDFPKVGPPATGDGIAVSPMRISMANAPIGNDLLIPLLNTDLLKQYRKDSVDEDCKRESFWTIIDALERALGGAGSIDTLVGGVEVTTDATDYSFKPVDLGNGGGAPAPTVGDSSLDPGGSAGLDTRFDDFDSGSLDEFDAGLEDFDGGFEDLGDGGFEDVGDTEFSDDALAESGEEADLGDSDSGDEAEISDSREVASGDDAGNDAGSDAAAITVGVLALLGAIALSLGDRVMGLRSQHMIDGGDE